MGSIKFLLVTVCVVVQMLPTGVIAQSTMTTLSASHGSDSSSRLSETPTPTLTSSIETLIPTPVVSSGVALGSVALESVTSLSSIESIYSGNGGTSKLQVILTSVDTTNSASDAIKVSQSLTFMTNSVIQSSMSSYNGVTDSVSLSSPLSSLFQSSGTLIMEPISSVKEDFSTANIQQAFSSQETIQPTTSSGMMKKSSDVSAMNVEMSSVDPYTSLRTMSNSVDQVGYTSASVTSLAASWDASAQMSDTIDATTSSQNMISSNLISSVHIDSFLPQSAPVSSITSENVILFSSTHLETKFNSLTDVSSFEGTVITEALFQSSLGNPAVTILTSSFSVSPSYDAPSLTEYTTGYLISSFMQSHSISFTSDARISESIVSSEYRSDVMFNSFSQTRIASVPGIISPSIMQESFSPSIMSDSNSPSIMSDSTSPSIILGMISSSIMQESISQSIMQESISPSSMPESISPSIMQESTSPSSMSESISPSIVQESISPSSIIYVKSMLSSQIGSMIYTSDFSSGSLTHSSTSKMMYSSDAIMDTNLAMATSNLLYMSSPVISLSTNVGSSMTYSTAVQPEVKSSLLVTYLTTPLPTLQNSTSLQSSFYENSMNETVLSGSMVEMTSSQYTQSVFDLANHTISSFPMASLGAINSTEVLSHVLPSIEISTTFISTMLPSAVLPTLNISTSPSGVYSTTTTELSVSPMYMPNSSLPILPTRASDLPSGNMSDMIIPSIPSYNISALSPVMIPTSHSYFMPAFSTSSVMLSDSVISRNMSDFLLNASSASDFIMQMTSMNISATMSSLASIPATNVSSILSVGTNITGTVQLNTSSVFSSFPYTTDIYTTSFMTTPVLPFQTPYTSLSNENVTILTPTVLLPTSNLTTTSKIMLESFNISAYSGSTSISVPTSAVSITLFQSTEFVTSSSVSNSSTALPTSIQPSPVSPRTQIINVTSSVSSSSMELTGIASSSVTSSSLHALNTSSVLPTKTVNSSVSMTHAATSMSGLDTVLATAKSHMILSSAVPNVTLQTSPVAAVSSSAFESSSTLSTSISSIPSVMQPTLSTEIVHGSTSYILPTMSFNESTANISSVTLSLNSSVQTTISASLNISMSANVSSEMLISSTVVELSSSPMMTSLINVTSSEAILMTSSAVSGNTSSSIVVPTGSLTTESSVLMTTTPELNTTVSPSISTSPPTVENVTSANMTSENVTSLSINETGTLSMAMTSVISVSSVQVESTSVAPPTTAPAPTTTSTTTQPPTTTTNEQATYWMVTDIKVPLAVNITSPQFVSDMELGLAELYNEAFSRKQDIDAGTFDSLRRKRKRKRRAVTAGNITVDMKNLGRDPDVPGTVSMSYTVEKDGTLVPSTVATETIDVISDQEMAIKLRYVVTKKGKPFNYVEPSTTPTPVTTATPTSDSPQVWLIGVVVGGVLVLIILAIVGLCIVQKKTKKSGVDEEAEPKLMNLKNAPLDEDEEEEAGGGERGISKYSSNMSDKGSSSNLKVQSPKKQTYEVNNDTRSKEEDQHLYAEVKKPKKADLASRVSRSRNGTKEIDTEDDALIESPKKKKGEKGRRKKKQKDDVDDQEDEVITKTIHPASLLIPQHPTLTDNVYYSAEEEDDLKQRKAAERKKNKQRIREKKKKEKRQDKSADQLMVEYLAAQEEIDTVLEAPPDDNELPDVFVHKKKNRSRRESNTTGNDNMAFSAEESLQLARSRMHELLDDAFSLISPSSNNVANQPEDEGFHSPRMLSPKTPRSQVMLLNQRNLNKVFPADNEALSIGNKHDEFDSYGSEVILVDSRVASPYSGHDIFLARSATPDSSSESISVPEDTSSSTGTIDGKTSNTKKHSPMKIDSHKTSYKGEPILQTWSPYRAADQVALISMPNKMQTNLGRTSSARGKRPAANLLEKKSSKNGDIDSVPKPAFLKSRDLISSKGSVSDLSQKTQNGDLASKTSKLKENVGDNTSGPPDTNETVEQQTQFEDAEITKENSMLPSIRERKLAKAAKRKAKKGDMEMKPLNGKVGAKHKEPFKNVPSGEDEMDIITKSIQSAVTPDSTVLSIRNEIKSGIPDKTVTTSFSGPGRNSRASSSLADIA